ncbi:MAG: hypothetical protein WCS42_02685 [Verrucomicrobiota bacterium]
MALKRSIRVVLWLLGSLIALTAIAIVGAVGGCSNSYWWDRDQWNQEKIAKAYISFYTDKTNFPSSLDDLVRAGYLPEKADWYKEPPGFFAHPVASKDSSYIVLPPISDNVENLKMIGRWAQRDGKDEIDFSSPQNAVIRDTIKQLQGKRGKP